MARRTNECFIGSEYLTVEGTPKHPALIEKYANANVNKIKDEPEKLVGMDLETNHKTAELKLIGFWDGSRYSYYTEDFLGILFSRVKRAYNEKKSLCYWNRLDPFVIFKQFIIGKPTTEQYDSMERFGKISGDWDRKTKSWAVHPVAEIMIAGYHFGITNAIRSSIQFFYYRDGDDEPRTIWAFDIAQLYEYGIEREALWNLGTDEDPKPRLPYYEKGDESLHKIDWVRFENDPVFQMAVLHSNELDARAVYDLGNIVQEEFNRAFGFYHDGLKRQFNAYPNTLVSQGSLARSAIVATIVKKYWIMYPNEETERNNHINDDIQSISFINHKNDFLNQIGPERFNDFYCLTCEAYSGGYIEAFRFGYAPVAYYADLASAYPAEGEKIYSLDGAIITYGEGVPPRLPFSYCFIRGEIDVPESVNFIPITVKHPLSTHKDTNVRLTGQYRASYELASRDFMERQGTTFKNETWYNIQTTGKLSPIAYATSEMLALRARLRKANDSAQYRAKTASASIYGISCEATDGYIEVNGVVNRTGYRGGEYLNHVTASIITDRTRIKICEVATAIEKAGGKVVQIMTDGIFFVGDPSMIPAEFVREKKTVGYFEKPEKITNLICLGSGRYGYDDEDGHQTAKTRGLNVVDFHDPDGIEVEGEDPKSDPFDWLTALKYMKKTNSNKMDLNVRVLISVGMILNNHDYKTENLGLVTTEKRAVDVIVGKAKRLYSYEDLKDPEKLSTGLVDTRSLYVYPGMYGRYGVVDLTLPKLRAEMMKKTAVTSKDTDMKNRNKASKKYNKKNDITLKESYKLKYHQMKDYGYTTEEADTMARWTMDRIIEKLKKDGKI